MDEDELFQLDKELDKRLFLTSFGASLPDSSHFGAKKSKTKYSSNSKLDDTNKSKDSPPSYSTLQQNGVDDDELIVHEDFVQTYLSNAAQLQIKSFKTKCDIMSSNLQSSQKKMNKMSADLANAQAEVKKYQKENVGLSKQLKSNQGMLSLKDSKVNELAVSLMKANEDKQDVQKQLSQMKKQCDDNQRRSTSLQAQKNGLCIQITSAHEKHATEIERLKNQILTLQKDGPKASQKIHSLEKRISSLNGLIKKQEELICVLQKQKCNIAAAKAVECLEKEFLTILEPFASSNDE